MSAFDYFSVLLIFFFLEQQVSELIMTSQKPVDVDSGNNSMLDRDASVKY